jgi:hypothetical protein
MMRRARLRWLPPALCGLALSACSMVAPFEGVPRYADPGVVDAGPRIAVCYNAMFATPEAVRHVAEEACGVDGVPRPVEQDMRLSCPLLTPVRATFICVPPQ